MSKFVTDTVRVYKKNVLHIRYQSPSTIRKLKYNSSHISTSRHTGVLPKYASYRLHPQPYHVEMQFFWNFAKVA